MKTCLLSTAIAAATLLALPATAACYADYKAKQDNPLKLHYGVIELPDVACGSAQDAAPEVSRRIAADGWTLHIHQHAAPLALAADLDRLRELTDMARAAIEDAERSTEADTMDAVFEARDGAVDALRAILAVLSPTAS